MFVYKHLTSCHLQIITRMSMEQWGIVYDRDKFDRLIASRNKKKYTCTNWHYDYPDDIYLCRNGHINGFLTTMILDLNSSINNKAVLGYNTYAFWWSNDDRENLVWIVNILMNFDFIKILGKFNVIGGFNWRKNLCRCFSDCWPNGA